MKTLLSNTFARISANPKMAKVTLIALTIITTVIPTIMAAAGPIDGVVTPRP